MSAGCGAVNGWCTAPSAPVAGSLSNSGKSVTQRKALASSFTSESRGAPRPAERDRAPGSRCDSVRRRTAPDRLPRGRASSPLRHAGTSPPVPRAAPFARFSRTRPPAPALFAVASISSTCFRDKRSGAARNANAAHASALRDRRARDRELRVAERRRSRRRSRARSADPAGRTRSAPSRPRTSSAGTTVGTPTPTSLQSARDQPFGERDDVVLRDERRLDVDLRELRLPVDCADPRRGSSARSGSSDRSPRP